jgi:hypothetical protein
MTDINTQISWLQRHERLILSTMVLAVAVFLGNRWLDKSATDAQIKAAAAATVAAQAEASKKQADVTYAEVLSQANQQTALLQAQVASDRQTIASLVQSVASRDAASSNKISSVSGTKTPPQAVADLSTVYTLAVPIVPTDTGAVVATADLQQFTVAKIEGDTAKADLKDTRGALTAAQSEVTNLEGIVVEKDKIIAQDAVTLLAHDNAAKAEVKKSSDDLKAFKADVRKSKWRWFWTGVVVGFLGRQEIKSVSGI